MDPNLDRTREHRSGRLRYQQSSPTLNHASTRNSGPSPPHAAPQQQWEDVPLPYRPREWRDPSAATHVPEALFAWRLRPRPDEPSRRHDATRHRHRPRALRNLFSRQDMEGPDHNIDLTFLYPQLSPYDDQASSFSAPDELEHFPRSVSQPNTPSYWPPPQDEQTDEPPLMMIPRSPTYPPASRRRVRSALNVSDTTFTDEEEFSLFVQATAGIMPEPAYGPPDAAAATSHIRYQGLPEDVRHLQSPASDRMVSPLQETPTTMYALQQLAQLPHASVSSDQRQGRMPQMATRTRTVDEAAMAGVDLWIQPPSPSYDEEDVSPIIDDELPDYASSQQQAQAQQRAEAARRAQELQRRWRQSQESH